MLRGISVYNRVVLMVSLVAFMGDEHSSSIRMGNVASENGSYIHDIR